VRVPGEEKLRVRTARERTATAESPAEPDEPTDEQNNGDDAPDEPIGEADTVN